MHYLAEDPWPIVGVLGTAAAIFLIALKVTQQGKFLIWAGIALGVALLALGVERIWVTDDERIEAVVYDLARAVERSDADGVLDHLAPDAELEVGEGLDTGNRVVDYTAKMLAQFQGSPQLTRAAVKKLSNYKFDFVRVGRLTTSAGARSGRGTAEFRVYASGEQLEPYHAIATPPSGMDWSLGFQETEPGVWKVVRISPTTLGD